MFIFSDGNLSKPDILIHLLEVNARYVCVVGSIWEFIDKETVPDHISLENIIIVLIKKSSFVKPYWVLEVEISRIYVLC